MLACLPACLLARLPARLPAYLPACLPAWLPASLLNYLSRKGFLTRHTLFSVLGASGGVILHLDYGPMGLRLEFPFRVLQRALPLGGLDVCPIGVLSIDRPTD